MAVVEMLVQNGESTVKKFAKCRQYLYRDTI